MLTLSSLPVYSPGSHPPGEVSSPVSSVPSVGYADWEVSKYAWSSSTFGVTDISPVFPRSFCIVNPSPVAVLALPASSEFPGVLAQL